MKHLCFASGLLVLSLSPSHTSAMELHWNEGDVQAFPVVTQPDGKHLANGTLSQRIKGGRLHASLTDRFSDGRVTEDVSVLRLKPELVQEKWTWTERKGSEVLRKIEVDFLTGQADSMKMEKGEKKEWHEHLKIQPGQTFGGGGMSYAVKNLKTRLDRGEHVTLNTVSYGPKPRAVDVEVFREGTETLTFEGRAFAAEKLVIHPKLPALVKVFVKVPDFYLWLSTKNPPAILRFQAPIQEANDPIVWTDSIPSGGRNSG